VNTPHLTPLIHLAGFSTGIVLYAMLAVMTSRDAAAARSRGEAVNSLPFVAALLGVVWNIGALVIYGLRDFGIAQPAGWLVAIAFAALGFLPAVVVHSAMTSARGWRRAPMLLGYALSGAAAIFALGEGTASLPSRTALLTLTVGYLLLVTLVALDIGRDPGRRRSVTIVALAAFAASALHLGHDVAQVDSWFAALVGHHASIPLVLVILYQDYRFAFVDLFLRRAISIVLLVALAVALHVTVAAPLMGMMGDGNPESLLATAAHIGLWVGTALAYPLIYRVTSHLVDRIVLRRGDYAFLRQDVASATARAETEEEAAECTCRIVHAALGGEGRAMRFVEDPDALPSAHARVVLPPGRRDEAQVMVPTHDRPSVRLEVGPLQAGRRLLSDEVVLLESVATLLGRRIDVIRVARERFERDLREREITQLATESELRALRAQLNPHFLFNALTTLGYLMQAAPDRALGTLYRLTELLRAVLRGPASEAVSLGEELEIVEAYLAIEGERFQERLSVTIDVPEALREVRLPPLLLQPLVENAVKHGISPLRRGGAITITARVLRYGARNGPALEVVVADTGVGLGHAPRSAAPGEGVGLSSIERRLERLYGNAAMFSIVGTPDRGTIATVQIPVEAAAVADLTLEVGGLRSAG
jgi:two-component system LytT family sensor kinase